jgi:hypothetical protein
MNRRNDVFLDGRRNEARKRRPEELELRSLALDRLLLKLRISTHAEARGLIDFIQQDASLEKILAFLDKHLARSLMRLAERTLQALLHQKAQEFLERSQLANWSKHQRSCQFCHLLFYPLAAGLEQFRWTGSLGPKMNAFVRDGICGETAFR